jgi:hypothetical protein
MAFKTVESILQPDPRFADLCVVENGATRRMTSHAECAEFDATKISLDADHSNTPYS